MSPFQGERAKVPHAFLVSEDCHGRYLRHFLFHCEGQWCTSPKNENLLHTCAHTEILREGGGIPNPPEDCNANAHKGVAGSGFPKFCSAFLTVHGWGSKLWVEITLKKNANWLYKLCVESMGWPSF